MLKNENQSNAQKFCCLVASSALGFDNKESINGLIDKVDSDLAIRTMIEHGLMGIAQNVINRQNRGSFITKDNKNKFVNFNVGDMILRENIKNEINALLSAANTQNVSIILLKGLYYSEKFYNPQWMRSFSDIDILIREDGTAGVLKILSDIGAKNITNNISEYPKLTDDDIPQHINFKSSSGVMFDLAYDILKFGLRSPLTAIAWQTARDAELLGYPVKVLSPEVEILNMCGHLHRHGFNRLIWFVDLGLAVQKLNPDWDEITRLAKVCGLSTSLHSSLKYLNAFLGEVVPRRIIDNCEPSKIKRLHFTKHWPADDLLNFEGTKDGAIIFRGHILKSNLMANLFLTGGSLKKSKYFIRKLIPSSKFLTLKYQDHRNSRSYVALYFKRIENYYTMLKKEAGVTLQGKVGLKGKEV